MVKSPATSHGLIVPGVLILVAGWVVGVAVLRPGATLLGPPDEPGLEEVDAPAMPRSWPGTSLADTPGAVGLLVVSTFTSQPLGGAQVRDLGALSEDPVVCDTAGQATVRFPAGLHRRRCFVEAAGHVGMAVELRPGEGGPRTVVALRPLTDFEALRTVRGRVVGRDDEPAAGARVTVHGPGNGVVACVCDEDGRFRAQVPGGWFVPLVRAEHARFGTGGVVYRSPDEVPFSARFTDMEILIRLGTSVDLPIAILADGEPSRRGYQLSIHDLAADPGGGQGWSKPVRDGDLLTLRSGVWRLTLLSAGADAVAEPLELQLGAEGVRKVLVISSDGRSGGPQWCVEETLDRLEFLVREGCVSIRVRCEDRPLPGAAVRVEPAVWAEPFLARYSERTGGRGLASGDRLGSWSIGRRAPAERSRDGRTGDDGVLTLPGHLPEPAVVWVHGDGIVDRFVEVPSWGEAGDPLDVEVDRSCHLEVLAPSWMSSVKLRSVPAGDLWRYPLPCEAIQLPPGAYVIRDRLFGGGSQSQEVVLHGPFEAPAGGRIGLDLTRLRPLVEIFISLAPSDAVGDLQVRRIPEAEWRWRGASGEPIVVRSSDEFSAAQFEVAWLDRGGVRHVHRVGLPGLVDPSVGLLKAEHELAYEGCCVDLTIANAADSPQILTLSCSAAAAPSCRSHRVNIEVPAASRAAWHLSDLPGGTYRVVSGSPQVRVSPSEIILQGGGMVSASVALEEHCTRIQVDCADPDMPIGALSGGVVLLRGPLHLLEGGTASARRPETQAWIGGDGCARVPGLEPGVYHVSVSWPGALETSSDPEPAGPGFVRVRVARKFVDVGTVTIAPGRSELRISVPGRGEGR
ncbi:MAG: carboxypeptidase-like regulatory domain-containing protein [Planctomycetes bacterium]|jgi:hypothetical protein|nr:carboxypeptidase-like regulatory domain-containing protein [Planctomycetota bacterium]